jgi:hypothetical protein
VDFVDVAVDVVLVEDIVDVSEVVNLVEVLDAVFNATASAITFE